MDKKFLIILGVVVAVLIGAFILAGGKNDNSGSEFSGDATQVQENDWAEGPREAEVVLIEYGDFQCPGCGALFPALEQVKAELGEQFLFVFRHFPLTSIHPNAMAAHRAAEAAGRQGQFFTMHDTLFTRQSEWSQAGNASSIFEAYAEELQLNMDQFRTDVASEEVFNRISSDMDSGNQLGLTSTPSLLLNGQKIDNPQSVDDLRAVIQEAINTANAE